MLGKEKKKLGVIKIKIIVSQTFDFLNHNCEIKQNKLFHALDFAQMQNSGEKLWYLVLWVNTSVRVNAINGSQRCDSVKSI